MLWEEAKQLVSFSLCVSDEPDDGGTSLLLRNEVKRTVRRRSNLRRDFLTGESENGGLHVNVVSVITLDLYLTPNFKICPWYTPYNLSIIFSQKGDGCLSSKILVLLKCSSFAHYLNLF